MSDTSHLLPEVEQALCLEVGERIEFCRQDRWVGYTRAIQILEQLDDLLTYPKSLRMPNLLVVGRSGNGKSSLIERFTNRHHIQARPTGTPIIPILSIEMPEVPTESELWSLILLALGISHRERDPAHIKKRQAKSVLGYAEVRVLVIDEFNNLTRAGKHAGALLSAIKGLSNDLKLSIVAAGTQEAVNALNSDPQMQSRFQPAVLDRWKLDREYLKFLASYERLLPLQRPSNLASREIAPLIHGMAGDTIGAAVKLIKAAAVHAIKTNAEKIDANVLGSVNWVRVDQWAEVGRRA